MKKQLRARFGYLRTVLYNMLSMRVFVFCKCVAIWFGNVLHVWVDLSMCMSMFVLIIGYLRDEYDVLFVVRCCYVLVFVVCGCAGV